MGLLIFLSVFGLAGLVVIVWGLRELHKESLEK